MIYAEKEKLTSELLEKIRLIGEMKDTLSQLKSMMSLGDFLENIHDKAYLKGFEEGKKQWSCTNKN